ncbi:UNVERIFIED_CONTAM: hypothetical protein GTU68_039832 [Idotea baltica]|nr:hypothetical protein [Idotea baltica]
MNVSEGETVTTNQPIAVIEAMKMESAISAPMSGTIERVAVAEVGSVEAGDLLAVLKPGPAA